MIVIAFGLRPAKKFDLQTTATPWLNNEWHSGSQRQNWTTISKTWTPAWRSETTGRMGIITTTVTYRLAFSSLRHIDLSSRPVDISKSPIDEATILAVQQHMAQQAAFSQIPDVVKAASCLMNFRSAR